MLRRLVIVVGAFVVIGALEPSPGESAVVAGGDKICVAARAHDHRPGPCAVGTGSNIGAPARPSARELARLGPLHSLDGGVTLRVASATRAVYCRTWSQWERGLYYVNWMEKHVGKFCYDGKSVWIDDAHGGYHRCDQGYGVLYDIEVKSCVENKIFVDTSPGYGYQNWDYYRVHVVWKGMPIYRSGNMHANVYPSGNVHFKN